MSALQLRRGLKANLAAAAAAAAAGEPLFATDTNELFIGTGAGAVKKLGDVLFSESIAPDVVDGKIWIDTATNQIYRADVTGGVWVSISAALSTDVALGGATPSDETGPSQKAVKTYVDAAVGGISITPDTDVTLGGVAASDTEISSQKAVKTYVDAAVGGITITPDTDATLGGVSTSDTVISSQKAVKTYVDTTVAASVVAPTTDATLGGGASSDTVAPSQKAVKTYVDNAVTAIQIPAEWPSAVIDIVNDPPAAVAGDRYLVGTAPTGVFVGHANEIAELQADGVTWAFTAPVNSTFLNVDSNATGLYFYGGVNWVLKSFELTTAGPGFKITSGMIELDPNMFAADSGLEWDPVGGLLKVGVIDGGTF